MLGSVSEADDAVQEAWLRLSRVGHLRRREPARLADHGRRAGVPRHAALPRVAARGAARAAVPEPIVSRDDGVDPEHEALLADSVGLALLVVLETLSPAERLAFVLHDMFAVPFDEIAPMVERSPAAARQLASRARRRVQGAGAGARRRASPASASSSTPSSPPPASGDFDALAGRARPRRRAAGRPRRAAGAARPGSSAARRRSPSRRRPSRGSPDSHGRRS